MATYQELRARSQQVRDEQNIGGNTALRVGQLLMDIVKYFNDNDEAANEYLQQHFAMVNDGTQLLNWQQSPIVILHTMGEAYDDGDFSALSQGENYYRAGFIMEANGQGGGINGETPKANVLYVNLANDTLYTWNGASFDAITSGGGGGSISGDDILKNAYYLNGNLVLVFETESGDKTVTIPVNFDASNYVPTSRTVNGKALSNNITLSQSDIPGLVAALAAKVGYSDGEWLQVKAGAMQAASAVQDTTTVNGKRLNNDIVIQMTDIPGLVQAIANAGSGAVNVTTNHDGTFVIHVGSTDYTINLNHTHEGMAKLVKCTEATLPQTLADDTIYVQVDNLTTPSEIEALHIFGLEFTGGGAAPGTPRLTSPSQSQISNGIDIGNTTSGVATYLLNIKARDLTQSLLVQWGSGSTGYSFDTSNLPTGVTYDSGTGKLTITKEAACEINGVDIPVVYTGNDTDENAEGTLGISSSSVDGINVEVTLVANRVTYTDIAGVKLTGTQWLQTDYKPNANTEFVMRVHYEANSMTTDANNGKGCYILCCPADTANNKKFVLYTGAGGSGNIACQLLFNNESSLNNQIINMASYTSEFYANEVTISYVKGSSNGTIKFNGGTERTHTTVLKTTTMPEAMAIGYHQGASLIYNVFDMTIFELTITENGNTVRHYVPKLRNGIPGLYDTVTDTFISSETSTELVAVN